MKRQRNENSLVLQFGKFMIAAVLAFVILTVFCILYYNIPSHAQSPDGVTDYKWEENTFYSRGTEGFACGKTNNEGYLNTFDYEQNTIVDILIMGSSHMEAYQVSPEESTASRLNSLLKDKVVYNIGISGHTFLTCANNLDAAICKYQPTKYIVIETGTIQFSETNLSAAINGNYAEIPSQANGVARYLQKNQLLRLAYSQMKNYFGKQESMGVESNDDLKVSVEENTNRGLLEILLKRMANMVNLSGAKLIIVYHPKVSLNEDGSLRLLNDEDNLNIFSELCSENGIYFLDMSERFMEEYKSYHILPYGFTNTAVGEGHLNKYGHIMLAEELYKIMEDEK